MENLSIRSRCSLVVKEYKRVSSVDYHEVRDETHFDRITIRPVYVAPRIRNGYVAERKGDLDAPVSWRIVIVTLTGRKIVHAASIVDGKMVRCADSKIELGVLYKWWVEWLRA
jgi:hypothetical protein